MQNHWRRWWQDSGFVQVGDVPADPRAGARRPAQRALHRAPAGPGDAVPGLPGPEEAVAIHAGPAALRVRCASSPCCSQPLPAVVPAPSGRVSRWRSLSRRPRGTAGRWRRRSRGRSRRHRLLRFLSARWRRVTRQLHHGTLCSRVAPHVSSSRCLDCGHNALSSALTNTSRLILPEPDLLNDVQPLFIGVTASACHTINNAHWTCHFFVQFLVIRLPARIFKVWILFDSEFQMDNFSAWKYVSQHRRCSRLRKQKSIAVIKSEEEARKYF